MVVSFSGLSLTEVFEIPQIQSFLLKIWYHGLLSDCDMAEEELAQFRLLKRTITFANCFTVEMQVKMYYRLFERLSIVLSDLNCQKVYQTIVGYMKSNKLTYIAYQIFGLHFLQLFGKLLEEFDDQRMTKIIRKVFIGVTEQDSNGKTRLRKQVEPADIEEYLSDVKERIGVPDNKIHVSSFEHSDGVQQQKVRNMSMFLPRVDTRSMDGRMKLKQFLTNTDKVMDKSGLSYPIGDRMRSRDRASISCFMVGGFEVVDYSESINHLHRKLLTKIRLNK